MLPHGVWSVETGRISAEAPQTLSDESCDISVCVYSAYRLARVLSSLFLCRTREQIDARRLH